MDQSHERSPASMRCGTSMLWRTFAATNAHARVTADITHDDNSRGLVLHQHRLESPMTRQSGRRGLPT
jgi:hypothetical protein